MDNRGRINFSNPLDTADLKLRHFSGREKVEIKLCVSLGFKGVVTDPSAQTAAPPTQDASGQQPLAVENTGEHATAYSYQQSK